MTAPPPVIPAFVPVGPELVIILALLILLFGANRIPKVARATGRSISEFRRGREESTESSEQSGKSTTND